MYSAGLLFCPRCFRVREFYVETMARPGHFPECFCVACEYEFPEGTVPDAKRIQAIEDLRAEQIRYAAVEERFDLKGRPKP